MEKNLSCGCGFQVRDSVPHVIYRAGCPVPAHRWLDAVRRRHASALGGNSLADGWAAQAARRDILFIAAKDPEVQAAMRAHQEEEAAASRARAASAASAGAQVAALLADHAEAIRAARSPLAARDAVAAAIGRSLSYVEGEAVSAASRAARG